MVIPESCTSIGNFVFTQCPQLTELTVSAGNKAFQAEGGILYDYAKKRLFYAPACVNPTLPETLTQISTYSFYYNPNLTEVKIPASVTQIGDGAFGHCTALSSVTFAQDSKLDDIGMWAFYECPEIKSLCIPSSCQSIKDYSVGILKASSSSVEPYDDFVLLGTVDSAAQAYAQTWGIPFADITKEQWVETKVGLYYYDNGKRVSGWRRIGDKCCFFDNNGIYDSTADNRTVKDVKAATCLQAGYTGDTYCICCGELLEKGQVIPLSEHDWNSGVVSVQPTQTSAGTKVYTCLCCGETKNETIPSVAPAFTDDCGGDTSICPSAYFTDVAHYGDWSHSGIDFCIDRQLFGGISETSFAPNMAMTRAMLVTVLWRYQGSPMGFTNSFTDVKDRQWYTDAVSWASSYGIVNGTGNSTFDPEGIVTREQMAAILYRYSIWRNYSTDNRADFSAFPDSGRVSVWAKDAIQWAIAENLIGGSKEGGQTYILPSDGATRAQVAAILMRFVQNIAE